MNVFLKNLLFCKKKMLYHINNVFFKENFAKEKLINPKRRAWFEFTWVSVLVVRFDRCIQDTQCLLTLRHFYTSWLVANDGFGGKSQKNYIISYIFLKSLQWCISWIKYEIEPYLLSYLHRVSYFLGYKCRAMVNTSWYLYSHMCDTKVIKECQEAALKKGQALSGYYRVLLKDGGWIWMQTKANVVYQSSTGQPQFISCVHYVIRYAQYFVPDFYSRFYSKSLPILRIETFPVPFFVYFQILINFKETSQSPNVVIFVLLCDARERTSINNLLNLITFLMLCVSISTI